MDPWIIDFGPYIQSGGLSASEADMTSLGKSLVDGLSQGVVYVKNSGIQLDKIRHALDMADRFFALPLEVKQTYQIHSRSLWIGYEGLFTEWFGKKYGQPADQKEAYNFHLNSQTPDLHPDKEVPGFSEAMMEAGTPFDPLSRWVLQCIALSVGLKRDAFECCFKEEAFSNTSLKLVSHPPIGDTVDLSSVVRCGQHVDALIITWDILDSVGGLQMQQKDGSWVDVPPISDTIVLIPGKSLEILLADRIPAAMHQVVVTNREMARQRRRAFICFCRSHMDAILKPLDGSTVYPPTSMKELAELYASYSTLDQ